MKTAAQLRDLRHPRFQSPHVPKDLPFHPNKPKAVLHSEGTSRESGDPVVVGDDGFRGVQTRSWGAAIQPGFLSDQADNPSTKEGGVVYLEESVLEDWVWTPLI